MEDIERKILFIVDGYKEIYNYHMILKTIFIGQLKDTTIIRRSENGYEYLAITLKNRDQYHFCTKSYNISELIERENGFSRYIDLRDEFKELKLN